MAKTELRIRVFGDAVLRKKAKRIPQVTDVHRGLLSEMARLMYAANGVGLAAPQVGINESLVVIDTGTSGLFKLANPHIVKREGAQAIEEGCLSVPGVSVKVKRAKRIEVAAVDQYGKAVRIEASDLLACVFQHEIDHLEGKLIVDYAPFFKKLKIKRQLEMLSAQSKNEPVPEPETKSGKLQL